MLKLAPKGNLELPVELDSIGLAGSLTWYMATLDVKTLVFQS